MSGLRSVWAAGTVLSTVCLGVACNEPLGVDEADLFKGTLDTSSKIPQVINISGCTGTLISNHVVLTAGHCVGEAIAERCKAYNYIQSGSAGANGRPALIPSALPGSTPDNPNFKPTFDGALPINEIGYATNPNWLPNLVQECCPGVTDPVFCSFCSSTPPAGAWASWAHEEALVYLDQPVTSMNPMPVLMDPKPNSPPMPSLGRYPVDVTALSGHTFAFAGTSSSDAYTTISRNFGTRTFTTSAFNATVRQSEPTCNLLSPPTKAYACTNCYIHSDANPSCGTYGDSGGPVLLNAPGLGGEAIAGVPSGTILASGTMLGGQVKSGGTGGVDPGSPGQCSNQDLAFSATWDFLYTSSGQTLPGQNGTWIRARIADFDNDGVPNDIDNCPITPNPMQENCNVDAEDAKGFQHRGNACDSIPCADTTYHDPTTVVATQVVSEYLIAWYGRAVHDLFDVVPRQSSQYGNGSSLGDPRPGLTIPNVQSYYRFCEVNTQKGIDCKSGSIFNSYLNPSPEGTPSVNRPYHVMHVVTDPTPGSPFSQEPLTYPQSQVTRRWKYQSDSQLWESSGWIQPVSGPDLFYGTGTNLNGRLWVRDDTTVGTFEAGSSTGYPVTPTGVVDIGNEVQLSNHYSWLAPDAIFQKAVSLPLIVRFYFFYEVCDPLGPIFDGSPLEDGVILPLAQGKFGLLQRTGQVADLTSYLGKSLASQLNKSFVWAPAAEAMPAQTLPKSARQIDAIAVAADGSDIVDTVIHSGAMLNNRADAGLGSISRGGGPSSRSGFAAVFARSEDRVFIVGGTSGGLPIGDIWMRGVEGAPAAWEKVPISGITPQIVLSATYSFYDRQLWILDRTSDGKTARLLRVVPTLGTVELVGSWTWTGSWDQYWLELDRDGQVLLIASSAKSDQHAVARFQVVPMRPEAPITISNFKQLSGAFALPPAVHAAGYSFYTNPGGKGIVTTRLSALQGSSVPLSQLSEVF